VTGNTVIDALLVTANASAPEWEPQLARALKRPGAQGAWSPCTGGESWGVPMERVAQAIRRVSEELPEVTFLFPIPSQSGGARDLPVRPRRREAGGVLRAPSVSPLRHLMKAVDVVITDSGGIQEEAPTLGKPVLVMRDTTERPEGVEAGTARLVGTDCSRIADQLLLLLTDRSAYEQMANAVNPYGDGRAAERIANHLEHRFGLRVEAPGGFADAGS